MSANDASGILPAVRAPTSSGSSFNHSDHGSHQSSDHDCAHEAEDSSPSQALRNSGIVYMIFENLIEPRGTLFAAIQVNRCWAEECCRVLWGLDEPDGSNYVSTCMMTLAKLLPARQQHYANMISCLVLVGAECFQAASETTHVHFPNLRDLRIYGVEEPFQKPLSLTLNQFLQPNLRFLILSLDRSSENFFELLETRCPNLDHFQILNMSCCPREPFLGFLERVQRLRTIRTWQGKPWLNDELFCSSPTPDIRCYEGQKPDPHPARHRAADHGHDIIHAPARLPRTAMAGRNEPAQDRNIQTPPSEWIKVFDTPASVQHGVRRRSGPLDGAGDGGVPGLVPPAGGVEALDSRRV
ncbi:hypothetical protein ANO11243_038680 [Dothideomycetidae sp. 11243]|nr:hypothetical protein ANO11243_038680 [fungal sp. No.11243]